MLFWKAVRSQTASKLQLNSFMRKSRMTAKVDDSLKLIYHEALYGSDRGAKLRIKNRVTHFRRTLRYCEQLFVH